MILEKNSSNSGGGQRKKFFHRIILSWFLTTGRKFLWREEIEPFKILIAEIMLQRTKAEQVAPVYSQFIKEFYEWKVLASANVEEVAKYFKKLGLLWRVQLIISMAKFIMDEYKNEIPSSKIDLLKIPGIGEYTADAIKVFVYNHRLTVIDSNVIRLVSRFFGFSNLKGEIRRNKLFREFCQTLSIDLDENEIRNFNWGLIDFSSLVCKPVPRCNICPLSIKCDYFRRINNQGKTISSY